MNARSQNFIKSFFLEKLLDGRLFLIKETNKETDFFNEVRNVQNILIILPIDKTEEISSRKFLKDIQQEFSTARISAIDLSALHQRDSNWLGVPNHRYLANIRRQNFNLLMDINGHHDRICAYLAALTEIPLRVHATTGKFDKIYNLHIRKSGKATLNERYQNILSYIIRMRQNPD
jgi:hypothetical protein